MIVCIYILDSVFSELTIFGTKGQVRGSVLCGRLSQSFNCIFLNPLLKLADPELSHLTAH